MVLENLVENQIDTFSSTIAEFAESVNMNLNQSDIYGDYST